MAESPFTIQVHPDPNDPLTFSFSILENGMPVGDNYVFLWDFGDGNESEEPTPTHTYAPGGPYMVSCQVVEKEDRNEDDKKTATAKSKSKPKPPPEKVAVL